MKTQIIKSATLKAGCFLVLSLMTYLTGISNQEPDTLDVVYFQSKPIVSVILNGKKCHFLVDSGVEISLLNYNTKKQYGFNAYSTSQKIRIIGFGGTKREIYHVRNATLQLGNSIVTNKLYSLNINEISKAIKVKTGFEITGIIGMDIMIRYGFIIDYKRKVIQFEDPKYELQKRRKKELL